MVVNRVLDFVYILEIYLGVEGSKVREMHLPCSNLKCHNVPL